MPTPTQQLTAEVLAWPGTTARIGARDEYGFLLGGQELGHLHGDRVAHFGFPRDVGAALRDAGRVGPHPVNRHSPKMAARDISGPEDVTEVLALLRLNYDRHDRRAADEAAVRAVLDELDAAQRDVDRFTALLAEDVSIVNVAGVRVRGRAAMREAMAQAMAGDLARVATRVEVVSLDFPSAGVAVVAAVKHIDDGRPDGDALPPRGAYTLTLVRGGTHGWLVASAQTTPQAG